MADDVLCLRDTERRHEEIVVPFEQRKLPRREDA
ncbi:MAG: hypothetical protein ACI831_000095 [Candidatus Azotimanducaceae bacterium]|jgi:hypothetical protein